MARRIVWVVTSVVLAAIAVGCGFYVSRGPFTREEMAKSLGDALASTIDFGTFRQTYFPRPGCIATNLQILPKQGVQAGHAEIARFRAETTWTALLRHHVRRMVAEGLTVRVRSLHDRVFVGNPGRNIIDELDLLRADLQLGARRFQFHDVALKNVGSGLQLDYQISVAIPQPAGELELHGRLGPFRHNAFAQAALSGSYTLTRADLGVFPSIGGKISSQGSFSGALSKLNFHGTTDIPDFEVTETRHTHHLATEFQAVVNATDGDTVVPDLRATLDQTSFAGSANVAGRNGSEKTASLDVVRAHGRIQDLMLLFIKARQSPILGAISFRAHIVLPPGERPFKQRVTLNGEFGIAGAGFTKPETQANADELSERAEGEPKEAPERVLSDLGGRVTLRDGIANFSDLSFRVPGAVADLSGTYNLVNEHIDLHGKLATEAKLSKTTTGIKSVFLKLLDPVFKRKPHGAVIPVSVSGTYDSPSFHEVFTK